MANCVYLTDPLESLSYKSHVNVVWLKILIKNVYMEKKEDENKTYNTDAGELLRTQSL